MYSEWEFKMARSTQKKSGSSMKNMKSTNKNTGRPANEATKGIDKEGKSETKCWRYIAIILVGSFVSGICHSVYCSAMFESDRHFSHLSEMEREMCFRTEMGFYYMYFKNIAVASSLSEGVGIAMHDNGTEYPDTINGLRRFNVYPEVFIGSVYRSAIYLANILNIQPKICYRINRGKDLAPVPSCIGWGDKQYFYVNAVWMCAGLTTAVLFLYGSILSSSIFGGLIAVLCFMFNHAQATRVQWTPPLRESFGYPIFITEMFFVTCMLGNSNPGRRHQLFIALTSLLFMLSWQFAQFALTTQTCAVMITFFLGFTTKKHVLTLLVGQFIALCLAFVLLFFNNMLVTSTLAGCLLCSVMLLYLKDVFGNLGLPVLKVGIQVLFLFVGTVGIKYLLAFSLGVNDDAHIMDILKSKFTDFKNFHTMLYTCAVEFDYLEISTYVDLSKTLLLPIAIIVSLVILVNCGNYWINMQSQEAYSKNETSDHLSTQIFSMSQLVYNVLQLLAFTILAVIIMRMKLFWTPHLCLLSSVIAHPKFLFSILDSTVKRYSVVCILLGFMSVQGIENIKNELSIKGEYSNPNQEMLFEWVLSSTPKNAVFAGSMPTMANLRLSTTRNIVNHPHYEDAGLRDRVKKVYSIFSLKPPIEVYKILLGLKVNFAVMERSWCALGSKNPKTGKVGCAIADIWKVEDKRNKNGRPFCLDMKTNPKPYFEKVFENGDYFVLKVLTPEQVKNNS